MFSSSRKGSLLYELRKIVFNLFSRSITWEYRELEGIRMGDRGLQGVTGGYKEL